MFKVMERDSINGFMVKGRGVGKKIWHLHLADDFLLFGKQVVNYYYI